MNRVDAYVHRVLAVGGLPPGHEQGEELREHIRDLVAEHRQAGLSPEQAVERALEQFGEPETAGLRLREVTPLPVSAREWCWLLAGVAVTALVFWWQLLQGWGEPIDWLPLLLVVGLTLAARIRHPLLATLAPALGVLVVRVVQQLLHWVRTPDGGLFFFPERNPQNLVLGMARLDDMTEVLMLVTASLILALAVSLWHRRVRIRMRRQEGAGGSAVALEVQSAAGIVPTRGWVLAGLAHLAPFAIVGGLSAGAAAVVGLAVLWYRCRQRSPFVARHLVQGALITALAVVSQVTVYQLHVFLWHNPYVYRNANLLAAINALVLGLVAVRLGFALITAYAALAAFSGHDLRYPGIRALLRERITHRLWQA